MFVDSGILCHHHFIQSGVVDMAKEPRNKLLDPAARDEQPESELAKIVAERGSQIPELTKEQKEENARFDKETIGGPTLFVNRHSVQTYADTGVRITFAEQYSGDLDVPPTYRTAVFMHTHT
jgi:hypothetical protein